MQQLKDIVLKNLAKDPIHYTKDGQFGVKDLGYVTEHPGLGTPKEPKGKYASSGYGNLNEAKELNVGDKVKYKGITVTVEKKDEVGNLVLKSESGKTIRANKAQFKEYGSLEEEKLRKAIREMIDAELEEATQMTTIIRPKTSDKEREERDPKDTSPAISQKLENYLRSKNYIKLSGNTVLFLARLFNKENFKKLPIDTDVDSDFVSFLNKASTVGGKTVKLSVDGIPQDFIPVNNVFLNRNERVSFFKPAKKLTKEDTLESLRESVEKDLAAINKEAEQEILQSKLDKIQELIDKKQSQLGKLDEDEDMKALTDAKKVKEIQKDIKALEKAKSKVEKMMGKHKGKKKEVIDETDGTESSHEYPDVETAEKDWQENSDMGQSDFE
jgi:hypothetical protein